MKNLFLNSNSCEEGCQYPPLLFASVSNPASPQGVSKVSASSRLTHFTRLAAMLLMLLTLGVGQVWGKDAHMYLIGQPLSGENIWAANNTSRPINSNYWNYEKFHIEIYMTHDSYFALSNGNDRYAPATQHTVIPSSEGEWGDYNHGGNSWKYTGPNGIVRVVVNESAGDNEWYPTVWVERPGIYLRHTWDGTNWTQSATMTDNLDGTYSLDAIYSGSSNGYSYYGWYEGFHMMESAGKVHKNGSPQSGDKCFFLFNSNVMDLTITRYDHITYNANNATSGSVPSVDEKLYGESTTIATNSGNLERTGYVFAGWNTAEDGSGTDYAMDASHTMSGDLLLYAKWIPVYAVNFGRISSCTEEMGSVTATITSTSQSLISGNAVLKGTNVRFEPIANTNYKMVGWHGKEDGTDSKLFDGNTSAVVFDINEPANMYAEFAARQYRMTIDNGSLKEWQNPNFELVDGVWTLTKEFTSQSETTYTFAISTDVDNFNACKLNPANVEISSTFVSQKGASTTDFQMTLPAGTSRVTFSYAPSSNTAGTLTVTKVQLYTITYGVETGSTDMGSVVARVGNTFETGEDIASGAKVESGSTVWFKATPKTGYSFVDWCNQDGSVNKGWSQYNPKDFSTISGDIDMYAKFQLNATYSLSVIAGGHIDAVTGGLTDQASVPFNGGTISATPAMGYDFATWTAEPAENAEFANASSASTTVTVKNGSVAVTATARVHNYNITYNGLEGATHTNPETYTIEFENITFTAPSARTGYTFAGWNPASIAAGSHEDKVVTANWTINHHTLTWNPDGGEITTAGTAAGEVNFGTALTAPTVAKTGYTFAGWSPAVAATMPDENATYTATWTENKVAITPTVNEWGNTAHYAASASVSEIGIETTTVLSCAEAGIGYTFTGWELSDNLVRVSGELTSTTITVRTNGDGQPVSAVAKYAEDLTTLWKLCGMKSNDWHEYAMSKQTGHSTEDVVYVTKSLEANTQYEFKVKNPDGALLGNEGTITNTVSDWDFYENYYGGGAKPNCKLTTTVAGDYLFKVDYSTGVAKVSVTYPTSYTVTFASNNGAYGTVSPTSLLVPAGAAISVDGNSLTVDGTAITATPTDETNQYIYAHTGWTVEDDATSVTKNLTITANFSRTEKTYTANFGVREGSEGHGSVTVCLWENGECNGEVINGGDITATKNYHLVATPELGYAVTGWYAAATGGGSFSSDPVWNVVDVHEDLNAYVEFSKITVSLAAAGTQVTDNDITLTPTVQLMSGNFTICYEVTAVDAERRSVPVVLGEDYALTAGEGNQVIFRAATATAGYTYSIVARVKEFCESADVYAVSEPLNIDIDANPQGWYLGYKASDRSDWTEAKMTTVEGVSSITMSWPAGSEYQFKLVRKNVEGQSLYYSNSGTMTAGNCTAWPMTQDNNLPNCRLATTVAGEYVFTLTSTQQPSQLSVTYPTIDGAATAYGNSGVRAANHDIMIQGFYWEFDGTEKDPAQSPWLQPWGDTRWSALIDNDYREADELAEHFDMVWLPASAVSADRMGYLPINYSNQTSDWGSAEDLKLLTARLKAKGSHPIADIVVNHMGNDESACTWPEQNFGSYGSFQPNWLWIPASDELFHRSDENGYPDGIKNTLDCCQYDPSDSRLFGDNYKIGNTNNSWSRAEMNCIYARDLAHDKDSVRMMVRSYLTWMRNEMGFDGWRWDFSKGINGRYIANYIEATQPYFSVCESFDRDGATRIYPVLAQAGYKTYMFDFPTKQAINQGIGEGNYNSIKMNGMIAAEYEAKKLNKYAVTFVENHDTFRENPDGEGDHLKNMSRVGGRMDNSGNKIVQANAYILSMPGVPCIFYPHWHEYKSEIKAFINARRLAGIHSESMVVDEVETNSQNADYNRKYIATVTGSTGTVILKLGPGSGAEVVPDDYQIAYQGENCGVYYTTTAPDPETPEVEIISLTKDADWYVGAGVNLTALTNLPSATYTWEVKLPNTDNFVSIGETTRMITYTLNGEGNYTFRVTATSTVDGSKFVTSSAYVHTSEALAYFVRYAFDGTNWADKRMVAQEDGTYTYYEPQVSKFGYTGKTCANVFVYGRGYGECRTPENPDNLQLDGTNGTEVIFSYNPYTEVFSIHNPQGNLYRVASVCGDKVFYSNTVTRGEEQSPTDQLSFFAVAGAHLKWQHFSGNDWVDAEAITTAVPASGVYTAPVSALSSAELSLTPYTGAYTLYGEQTNWTTGAAMTSFSSTTYYNNYYVKWIPTEDEHSRPIVQDVRASVGNAINHNLSGYLPKYLLPKSANVRYEYNSATNFFSRTTIAGSTDVTEHFIQIYGQNLSQVVGESLVAITKESPLQLTDGSNWVYSAELQAVKDANHATARLVAGYGGSMRWLLSNDGSEQNSSDITFLGEDCTDGTYTMKVIYDFKTNKLESGWVPSGTISSAITVNNMLVSRTDDGTTSEFIIANSASAIALDHMTTEFVITKSKWESWTERVDEDGVVYKPIKFWFSTPYPVYIKQIYGFDGGYNLATGSSFEIQRYRGDLRAQGTAGATAWRALSKYATTEANRGYVLMVRLKESDFRTIGGVSAVRIYMPSTGPVTLYESTETTLPANTGSTAEIQQGWNIMGVPVMAHGRKIAGNKFESVYRYMYGDGTSWYEPYDIVDNTENPQHYFNFEPGHAYMVQVKEAETLIWNYTEQAGTAWAPARVAPNVLTDRNFRVDLYLEDEMQDKTYIKYRATGTRAYERGRDLEKIENAGRSMIYSELNDRLAAICLADTDRVEIPLTVVAAENGEYTLRMPAAVEGLEPVLYDAEAGVTTFLNQQDYTISLAAGTYRGRFFLGIHETPATPTGVGATETEGEEVVKFVDQHGRLLILKSGKVYNAMGTQLR